MKIYIYSRVPLSDRKAAKTDKLREQEKRCREYLLDLRATPYRFYRDESGINPRNLPNGLRAMLREISMSPEEVVVVCDHPSRLGTKKEIREEVVANIDKAGGSILTVFGSLNEFNKQNKIYTEMKTILFGRKK